MVVTVIFCTKSFTKSLPRVRMYERESNYVTSRYIRKEAEVLFLRLHMVKTNLKCGRLEGYFRQTREHEGTKK